MKDEEGFPIEQDIAMPTVREVVHMDWRRGQHIAFIESRPYPNRRSTTPLKQRMRTLITCTMCHIAPVIHYDHYGMTKGTLKERLCADCADTYWRSGYSSQYQQRIDDAPIHYANMAHYRDPTRNEPSGEQRMAAAIIASAASDLHRKTDYHGAAKDRADAMRWLDGAKAPLTFNWCCEALDVDPQWTRHMVLTSGDQYASGYEVKRSTKGMHIPAVDECVPDVGGSERSKPMHRQSFEAATKARTLRQAIQAIAAYTG